MSLTTGSTTSTPLSRQALYAAKVKKAEPTSVTDTIENKIGSALGTTVSLSADALASLKNGASDVVGGIGDELSSTYQSLKNGVTAAVQSPAAQEILAIPETVVSNVATAAGSALNEVTGLATDAASIALAGSKLMAFLG